jgi:alpha-glucosidase (family GH31 glycosyl hydrolase)
MYGFVFEDERMSIPVGDNKITIYYSPFKMEFYATDVLQLVLDGTYLTFEDSLDQAFAFAVSFPQALQLYGVHEHADSLALQTTQVGGTDPYRLRNLDVSGYELNSPMALYGAVPVLYGHGY